MTQIGQTAKITIGGLDATKINEDGLRGEALLVYQAIVTELTKPGADTPQTGTHRGIPGVYWRGAMSRIVASIWPVQCNLKDPVTGRTLNEEVNTYLRITANAMCLHRGGGGDPPLWWIRSEWNGAPPTSHATESITKLSLNRTERELTPRDVGETRVPAPVITTFIAPKPTEVADRIAMKPPVTTSPPIADVEPAVTDDADVASVPIDYICKFGCGQSFTTGAARASHQRSHPRRSAIITQARRLYEKHGDFTVKDVSIAAGHRDASGAYGYFHSKDAIMQEVLADIKKNPSVKTQESQTCTRCGNAYEHAPALASHMRGHVFQDRIVAVAAKLVEDGTWPPPTLRVFADLVNCAPSALRDNFVNLDGVYSRAMISLTEQGITPLPCTGWPSAEAPRPITTEPLIVTDPEEIHALHLIQVFVGVSYSLGYPLSLTAVRFLPVGLNGSRFDAFMDLLTNHGVLTMSRVKRSNGGNEKTIYVPGLAFDQEIAARLTAFNATGSGAIVSTAVTTPIVTNGSTAVTAVLAKYLREAAEYVDQLEASIVEATNATADATAAHVTAKQEKERADELQQRLDVIDRALGR